MLSDCVALHGNSGAPIIVTGWNRQFPCCGCSNRNSANWQITKSIAVASTSSGLRDAVDRR